MKHQLNQNFKNHSETKKVFQQDYHGQFSL